MGDDNITPKSDTSLDTRLSVVSPASSVSVSVSSGVLTPTATAAAGPSRDDTVSWTFKAVVITALIIQNASVFLVLRITRLQTDYLGSSAVLLGEAFKLAASLVLVGLTEGGVGGAKSAIKSAYADVPQTLKVAVPGLLYTVQNNLVVLASSYLDAPTIAVLNQTKILTTAFFSVTILRRNLSRRQWSALCVLVAGVITVQMAVQGGSGNSASRGKNPTPSSLDAVDAGADAEEDGSTGEWMLGLAAVMTGMVLSGFTAVYFESILKGTSASVRQSVWIKNVQLAVYGIAFGLGALLLLDYDVVITKGFTHGFTPLVWFYVLNSSIGGLLISMTVRYTNAVVKNFATTMGTVLSSVYSIMFLGFPLSMGFVAGATMVFAAVFLYTSGPPKPTAAPTPAAAGRATVLPSTTLKAGRPKVLL